MAPSLSASIELVARQGDVRGLGAVAVEDGGTLPARRMRRAAPLPNSVRGSALMRDLGHGGTLLVRRVSAVGAR